MGLGGWRRWQDTKRPTEQGFFQRSEVAEKSRSEGETEAREGFGFLLST